MIPAREEAFGPGRGAAPMPLLSYWYWAPAIWDVWLGAAASRADVGSRAARRLAELVRFARARSPYYAELYRALPADGIRPEHVPPVTRRSLMERFDEWVTDPEVTLESARAFVADAARVGHPFLGRYGVWTSSGTSGEPGLFVHDARSLAVHDALETLRLGRGPMARGFPAGSLLAGGRYAMIAATGGHFAGVASVERMRSLAPALAGRIRVFSILEPLARLVAALNAYQPTLVATYPTVASQLAHEQQAGRLGIHPAVIWLGGETLSAGCREAASAAFGCRVVEEYGASECMSIACECSRGRLHVNSDWAMIEPVDREYRPVPAGTASHTALLTNLANRVQPVIRYDLGDSIVLDAEACACGSPFPTLRVQGRSDDGLWLRSGKGERVELLPLALTTVVEEFGGAYRFQIVQGSDTALSVRLEAAPGNGRAALWRKVERALRRYLDAQGLTGVALRLDDAPPGRSASSGKLRRVVASPGESPGRERWRGA
jgi:phenylacetate-coenzyme A ligase PaaK-like adenylate-forming protein